jgi:hypothetical protein
MNNVDENEIIEDVNMNIENNSIQKPTYYDSKINELDQRYNLIMNELSNNYNNGNNENIKTDEKNIEKLQNDFFLLKNDLLNNIGTVSDNVTRYDLEINKVVTQNKKLKKSYDEMKQKNSGSKGFARDTQVLYNQYLMGNFLIGLVAISSVLLYQKYYTTSE